MTTAGRDPAALDDASHVVRVLQFGDSMLPVGTFAFSGGLESAIQKRVVTDAETLLAFTRTAVEQAARGDGIAVIHAHLATSNGDLDELERIDARELVQVAGCRGAMRDQHRDAIAPRGLLDRGAREREQRGGVSDDALLDRGLEAAREGEGADRQHRVAELQHADEIGRVAGHLTGRRETGGCP
jgi:hypothetical protein